MKSTILPLLLSAAALALPACVGDTHVTEQSTSRGGVRSARTDNNPTDPVGTTNAPGTQFVSTRIYRITRLESAQGGRGEWRALGETIRQRGDAIEFTELGSGKFISFTAPHQVTATGSRGDQRSLDVQPGPAEDRALDLGGAHS